MVELYAGPMSRYYMRTWLTRAERIMAAHSPRLPLLPAQILDHNNKPIDIEKWIREYCVDSIEKLNKLSNTNYKIWDETPEDHYYSAEITWEGLNALKLHCLYHEQPHLRVDEPDLENIEVDLAFQNHMDGTAESRKNQFMYETELWFPRTFSPDRSFSFALAEPLSGEPIMLGSVEHLIYQLHDLNRATWREPNPLKWVQQTAPPIAAPMEEQAQYTFAILMEAANFAQSYDCPMKLDY